MHIGSALSQNPAFIDTTVKYPGIFTWCNKEKGVSVYPACYLCLISSNDY